MSATRAVMSAEEYVRTNFEPDCEYVDGELRGRNVGTFEHSLMQTLVVSWFMEHLDETGFMGITECRMQVSEGRFRIPDVTVLTPGRPPPVLTDPPLLVVEVFSPDDTYSEARAKVEGYRRIGIQNIWLIDPDNREALVASQNGSGSGWWRVDVLAVEGTKIRIDVGELFEKFDRLSGMKTL